MLALAGGQALSDFRARKLLARLQAVDASITAISGQYIHFIDHTGDLSTEDQSALVSLMTYGMPAPAVSSGQLFLVVPRPGTISPWSSKATDIAHNAGLARIKRLERGTALLLTSDHTVDRQAVGALLHDRMTESILDSIEEATILFEAPEPQPLKTVPIITAGKRSLVKANKELGLALAVDEIDYLYAAYSGLKRDPTDVELMMFAQVNSEHCRHKVFNADWVIDGLKQPKSLFKMIKNTYEKGGESVLSAYSDNAAVLSGPTAGRYFADPSDNTYRTHHEPIHTVIKVETHNHPTAIAPAPGAATGSGGEIRDEGATGRGAKPKMGLAGYSVSNLNIPGSGQPWEEPYGKPGRIASALDIMLEAPIGAAGFVNEFGRPNLTGYFRTYEQRVSGDVRGYHKPIMVAGGLGNIRDLHVQKKSIPVGSPIIVLGGPAMLIGLGGGAASSMQAGSSQEMLDFASVQRGNAEMERRAQQVIDSCWAMAEKNPILAIHDVGAGGLSNALPELVHDFATGAVFNLRDVPSAETGLSPLEIWCNEAQERYVLGVSRKDLTAFQALCERERCPFAVVGYTTKEARLVLHDTLFDNDPVDLPMEVLFGKPPKMTRTVTRQKTVLPALKTDNISVSNAIERVLQLPAVGSKKLLITIGDRSVGGMTTRDQMVGPWQVPVGDVAVTAVSYDSPRGEAMAMGERAPVALIDGPAAARMAIGETLTNMLAADIQRLSDVKLSANWMAAIGYGTDDESLYDTVKAVGEEFAPALGITIPVGKDSLSMRSVWQDDGQSKSVTAPLSLVISGFSPVSDVTKTLTPQLDMTRDSVLILIAPSAGKQRLGGSALAQVYNQLGNQAPDVTAKSLKALFTNVSVLKHDGKILAYHDRSDGGLLATVLEMAFASRCGLELDLSGLDGTVLEQLFNEELGAVIQVTADDAPVVLKNLGKSATIIGRPMVEQTIRISDASGEIYSTSRAQLESWWSHTSYQLQKLRDNPVCADQEFQTIQDDKDPGLTPVISPRPDVVIPASEPESSEKGVVGDDTKLTGSRVKPGMTESVSGSAVSSPKVAIFREQGVNGQVEMAAAFDQAGFTSVDVHLNDIISGRVSLDDFVGLAACGGFSYGDVLGAGEGWAKTILFNEDLRAQFKAFFKRPDTFSLGVCNGCQMLSALKELIPGAQNWPAFHKNQSEQFEARVVLTQINKSPSIFFKDMAGSFLPIPTAHGEGRAVFDSDEAVRQAITGNLVAMQYVDNYHRITEKYPANPNGSPLGITALTTPDGRATIIMPHPERAFQTRQLSWHPADWGEYSPWFRIFQNARRWVDNGSTK